MTEPPWPPWLDNAVLAPNLYQLPKFLDDITDDENPFEYIANPDDLGHAALHMEWSEPFTVHFILETSWERSGSS